MNRIATLLSACLAAPALIAGAAEPQAKAPITRAALFKNGYALVVREIPAVPGDAFLIDEAVTPVHGTLWFAPGDGLTVSGVKRIGAEPNRNPFADFSASYAGRQVTVTLRASGSAPSRVVAGTVVQPGRQEGEVAPNTPFFAVKGSDGKLTVFSRDEIVSIESDAINETLPEEKRMLLVNRAGTAGKPFAVSYLSAGLTWAPAYRIALGPDAQLQLDQSATLINELEDLKGVELNLVSGFPNLEYLRVTSPLATGMTLQLFLQQLNGGGGNYRDSFMLNKAAAFGGPREMVTESAVSPLPESGLSEDIHFTSAGKVTLPKGEVLYKTLASAKAKYERLVEWEIPDRRDQWGRIQFRGGNPDENQSGDLWDAVRFKNPLESPITTAPIEIVDGSKLLGQTTVKWVNPGEETLVRIAKALTVSGIRTETEADDKSGGSVGPKGREVINYAGYNYRKSTVDGEIKLRNFRTYEAKVIAKLQYSGEFLSAEGSPKSKLLESGVYSINPRRELTWEITLKPGEELTLPYKYTVMVRI